MLVSSYQMQATQTLSAMRFRGTWYTAIALIALGLLAAYWTHQRLRDRRANMQKRNDAAEIPATETKQSGEAAKQGSRADGAGRINPQPKTAVSGIPAHRTRVNWEALSK